MAEKIHIGNWEVEVTLETGGDFSTPVGKSISFHFFHNIEKRHFFNTINFHKEYSPEFYRQTIEKFVMGLDTLMEDEKKFIAEDNERKRIDGIQL